MYQVEGYAFETKEQEHTAKHEVEIIGVHDHCNQYCDHTGNSYDPYPF